MDQILLYLDSVSDLVGPQKVRVGVRASEAHYFYTVPVFHAATARDRDNGELKYSLRSMDMYAPWFRGDIVLLMGDEAPPSWLNTSHPRVKIVRHRTFFKNKNALPTFNSDAIQMSMHLAAKLNGTDVMIHGYRMWQTLSVHFTHTKDKLVYQPLPNEWPRNVWVPRPVSVAREPKLPSLSNPV